jgi:membrane protein implicated in regulation of membrane protease activity
MEWFRNRALTLVLMAMFVLFLVGQPLVTMTGYLATGHPWEALFENWESEFLQMAVFVLLTTCLVQKGSPESRRLGVKELVDADPRDFTNEADAP